MIAYTRYDRRKMRDDRRTMTLNVVHRPSSIVHRSLLIFIFLLLIDATAMADAVYLTSGDMVKGLVVEEHHDRIVFSTYKGEIQIPKISIEQIFFDNEEQNYAYLGDVALDEGDFQRALEFYQKAHQINSEFEKIRWAFLRLIDAVNREKFDIQPDWAPAKLSEQTGMTIERSKDRIRAKAVKENSPAKNAGIEPEDFIVDVWDASVMFMDAASAAELMVGAPNTPLKLTIEKEIALPIKKISWLAKIFHLAQFSDFGFNLSLKPSGLIVTHIKPKSPAEKNGLQAMDEVTHINGESTRYMPASLVRRKIFQSNLKEVVLTVKRRVILTRGGL